MEAALTGQLVLSSFHAGSAAEAVGRLLDMGIEPYVLRSSVSSRSSFSGWSAGLCTCARAASGDDELLGLKVQAAMVAVGCPACGGTGYAGRSRVG